MYMEIWHERACREESGIDGVVGGHAGGKLASHASLLMGWSEGARYMLRQAALGCATGLLRA